MSSLYASHEDLSSYLEVVPAISASTSASSSPSIYNSTPFVLTLVCTSSKHSASTVAAGIGLTDGLSFDFKQHQDSRSFTTVVPPRCRIAVPENSFISVLKDDHRPVDQDHNINSIFQRNPKAITITTKVKPKASESDSSSGGNGDCGDGSDDGADGSGDGDSSSGNGGGSSGGGSGSNGSSSGQGGGKGGNGSGGGGSNGSSGSGSGGGSGSGSVANPLATLVGSYLPPSLSFLTGTDFTATVTLEAPQLIDYGDTGSSSGLWYYNNNYLMLSHCMQKHHGFEVVEAPQMVRHTETLQAPQMPMPRGGSRQHLALDRALPAKSSKVGSAPVYLYCRPLESHHNPPIHLLRHLYGKTVPSSAFLLTATPSPDPALALYHSGSWLVNTLFDGVFIIAVSSEKPLLSELKVLLSPAKVAAGVDISSQQYIAYYILPALTALKIRENCWVTVFDKHSGKVVLAGFQMDRPEMNASIEKFGDVIAVIQRKQESRKETEKEMKAEDEEKDKEKTKKK